MRLEFQKKIASSQFTLPIVCIVATLMWLFLPVNHSSVLAPEQHGLWAIIPQELLDSSWNTYLSMGLAAFGVYLVAELTNTFVLLRISSRMLSSMAALFLGAILCLHTFSPGYVIMLFCVLSFFGLFYTYQQPIPILTFLSYLLISLGSLLFPQLLLIVPVYWMLQIYLRSLSIRCWVASILGVLVPYWIFFGVALCYEGGLDLFVKTCMQILDIKMPQYASIPQSDIFIYGFLVVFFLFGMVNFYMNSFLDKTRTRIIFKSIIIHGLLVALAIALQPHSFHTLLPLLVVDSAIVGGHFVALTYNRFSHIYCIVMLLILIALVVFQTL